MKLLAEYVDDQYPFEYIDHTRLIARAVAFNDDGEIALTKLNSVDKFGVRDYYELPGGGVQSGETPEEAIVRELKEEIGYEVSVVTEIGTVSDYYNLIHRHNVNHFFMVRVGKYVGQKLEPREQAMIEKIEWLPLAEAVARYENTSDTLIAGLVKRRELPILRLALKILTKQGKLPLL